MLAEGDMIQGHNLSLRGGSSGQAASPTTLPAGDESLRAQTAAIVQRYLDAANGNILQVAAQLQIGKSTIYRMLQSKEIHLR
jgi:transcriptional regulator of acetoin/glycerol metabolism